MRFKYREHSQNIRDTSNGLIYCGRETICDLLNELADENVQLKARIEYLERKIQRERASAMKQHEKWEEEIQKENEQLKDEIYDELDNALTVLTELYEVIPISSQSKMNSLYNRLKSLRDDMND